MHKSDEPGEVDAMESTSDPQRLVPSASQSAPAESSNNAHLLRTRATKSGGSDDEDSASDDAVSAHCACDDSCAEVTFATLAARPEHARTEGMCCDGTDDYKLAEMPGAKKT